MHHSNAASTAAHRAKKKQCYEALERGRRQDDDLETVVVYALEKFGSGCLEWDEDTLFYRAGVALRMDERKYGLK